MHLLEGLHSVLVQIESVINVSVCVCACYSWLCQEDTFTLDKIITKAYLKSAVGEALCISFIIYSVQKALPTKRDYLHFTVRVLMFKEAQSLASSQASKLIDLEPKSDSSPRVFPVPHFSFRICPLGALDKS